MSRPMSLNQPVMSLPEFWLSGDSVRAQRRSLIGLPL